MFILDFMKEIINFLLIMQPYKIVKNNYNYDL